MSGPRVVALVQAWLGATRHYIPVYRQPYYRRHWPVPAARFPGAEAYYRQALTLPLYPGLAEAEQQRVINIVRAHAEKLAR